MALQTSGAISLNDMNIEANNAYHGGSNVSINDADIRGLIGKSSATTMSFNEWYGASASLDTQYVTVGFLAGGQYAPNNYGYTGSIGSISDGTCNFKSGASISSFVGNSANVFNFVLVGIHSNNGWSYFTTDGGTTKFYRGNATYAYNYSTQRTTWTWLNGSNNQGTFQNPLGVTSGVTKTVVFQ